VPKSRLLAAHIGKTVQSGCARLGMKVENGRRWCGALQVLRNCKKQGLC